MSHAQSESVQHIVIWRVQKGPEVASCYLEAREDASIVRVDFCMADRELTLAQPAVGDTEVKAAAQQWLSLLEERGWSRVGAPVGVRPKADRRQSSVIAFERVAAGT